MSIDLRSLAAGSLVAESDSGALTREMLAAYAEASGDLNPLHLDPAFARKAGFDDVIVHGMLGMGLLGRLLTEQLDAARLRHFAVRFAGIVPVGQSLRCRAVLDRHTDTHAVLALEVLNPAGTAVILGSAHIAY
jgi:acyl dehydratase